MVDSYVCSKAKIKCSCGDRISTLTVFPDRTIWLTGEPQANISDHVPMRNIAPFGKCHTTAYPATGAATAAAHGKLTPMPCVPNTPFPWMGGKNDVLLQGEPALLRSSQCKCVYGGTITFTYDGQVDGTYSEIEKKDPETTEELDENAEGDLSAEEMLDGLQMALDAAGLFPGLGAIPDLLNACISACRGDWAGAGLSVFAAIPGAGDVAGAAKLIRNGAKIARKTKKVKSAAKLESMSEHLAKGPNKELAEARARKLGIDSRNSHTGSYFDSAPEPSAQKAPFGELTRRDRFEIEEARAIDAIQASEKPGRAGYLFIKDPPSPPTQAMPPKSGVTPEKITPKNIETPHGSGPSKIKIKPDPEKPKEPPVLGKNLDIMA